jgi:DNA-binding NarL/FixJ family response regulator
MATSWVRGAAARRGCSLEVVSTSEALVASAERDGTRLAIVDLGLAGLDVTEVVGRLKALAAPPAVVAFGPHVHLARLQAASAAGCDEVVSRGEFNASVERLLERFAPGERTA